jgi:hypothetical protein
MKANQRNSLLLRKRACALARAFVLSDEDVVTLPRLLFVSVHKRDEPGLRPRRTTTTTAVRATAPYITRTLSHVASNGHM